MKALELQITWCSQLASLRLSEPRSERRFKRVQPLPSLSKKNQLLHHSLSTSPHLAPSQISDGHVWHANLVISQIRCLPYRRLMKASVNGCLRLGAKLLKVSLTLSSAKLPITDHPKNSSLLGNCLTLRETMSQAQLWEYTTRESHTILLKLARSSKLTARLS